MRVSRHIDAEMGAAPTPVDDGRVVDYVLGPLMTMEE
jgi:hypothetical protein